MPSIGKVASFCSFFVSMLLCVSGARAQSSSSITTDGSAKTTANSSQDTFTIGIANLKYLEPSLTERLLRVWQYQYQLLEQPAYIVATSGNTTATIPNPNTWLQQHSLVLQLSELFPRSTNLPALVQAAYDTKYRDAPPLNPITLGADLCPKDKPRVVCLAGGGSFIERFFSAGKVMFGAAQRDEVQQGFLLPNLPISQSWGWNGEVDFDPTGLFTTSANWKSAVAVFGKGPDDKPRRFAPDDVSASKDCLFAQLNETTSLEALHGCEKLLTRQRLEASFGSSRGSEAAAILIPTLQFKVLSQFDFIKQGGLLTENPNLQRSLKTLTLSWDLRRRIPTTADRLTVAALYAHPVKPWTGKAHDNSQASNLGTNSGDGESQSSHSGSRVPSQAEVISTQQNRSASWNSEWRDWRACWRVWA